MSFLNPLFLLGALAASVPVVLHLIRRERARKVEFPTLMFLRRISRKTIRYQKLRHLLLLLCRILALMLIVLAFARPFRQIPQVAAGGHLATAHVILLDNSMSMSYDRRWSRAREAAAEIVRSSAPGDKFVLLEFSDQAVARTQLTADSSTVLAQIEGGVELTDHATKYGQALKAAEKLALDAGTGRRVIHLISDFQKSGWVADEQDFRLGAGMDLQGTDVGSNSFSNLKPGDVHIAESDEISGGGIILKCLVVNFGDQDRRNVMVGLSLDDRTVADKRIDLKKGSSEPVEFRLRSLSSGTHRLVLEVEDPGLTRDNRFYMTIESQGKTQVLLVDGPQSHRGRSSSFFLANALDVETLSSYKLRPISTRTIEAETGISGGLLIWNNAPGGGAEVQKKLRDFVKGGGGLAVVLADSSTAADFNRSFGSWLPVKVDSAPADGRRKENRPGEDYLLMTGVRLDHPIFRPFSLPHSGTFSTAKFFNRARLSVGVNAEVAARFDNGDPALVAIGIDKGRVLVFASSADDSSNDMPLKAVYAPFWQQMLRYLENFQERRHWIELGETVIPRRLLVEAALRQSKGNVDFNEAVVVTDPAKQRLSPISISDGFIADKAGFYEIRTVNLMTTVAANVPPRESDLSHGNSDEMVAGWLSPNPKSAPVVSPDEQLTFEEQERGQRLWRFILTAALVLLAAELLLSNRIAGEAGGARSY